MTHREALAAKIAALRAKTVRAGCTEAEALAAAELAARLMAEHGLSEAEIGISEARSTADPERSAWRLTLTGAIAQVTNTAGLFDGRAVLFVGRDPGPEIALYLRDLCFRAVEREVAWFRETEWFRRRRTKATRRRALEDFRSGLVARLSLRLREIFAPLMVPDHLLLAREALDKRHPDTKLVKPTLRDPRFSQAVLAGVVAGDRIPLSHGVGHKTVPLAIAGGKA